MDNDVFIIYFLPLITQDEIDKISEIYFEILDDDETWRICVTRKYEKYYHEKPQEVTWKEYYEENEKIDISWFFYCIFKSLYLF